jgi:hypothetical protein
VPGNRVIGARRLVRRLEGPKPDALVAAADLGVVRAVRPRADATVAGARAAAGRYLDGGAMVRREVGGTERGGWQRSERHAGVWGTFRAVGLRARLVFNRAHGSRSGKFATQNGAKAPAWKYLVVTYICNSLSSVNLPRTSFATPVGDALIPTSS